MMLLLLVSVSIYSNAKRGLPDYCKNMIPGKTNTQVLSLSLKKKKKTTTLIWQKYMTQETAAQNIKNQLKSSTEIEKAEELKRKPMHGQFYWDNERPSVGKEKSTVWLCHSGLKGEIENLIIAAQDKALKTRYCQRNIMKQLTVNAGCAIRQKNT